MFDGLSYGVPKRKTQDVAGKPFPELAVHDCVEPGTRAQRRPHLSFSYQRVRRALLKPSASACASVMRAEVEVRCAITCAKPHVGCNGRLPMVRTPMGWAARRHASVTSCLDNPWPEMVVRGAAMQDVFISFSTEDAAAAEELERFLTANGISSFKYDRSLPPGSDFQTTIDEALKGSAATVGLLSEHTFERKYVEVVEFSPGRLDKKLILLELPTFDAATSALHPVFAATWRFKLSDAVTGRSAEFLGRIRTLIALRNQPQISRRALGALGLGLLVGAPVAGGTLWTHQRAQRAARSLYGLLDLAAKPVILHGSDYINYPEANQWAAANGNNRRSVATADQLLAFATEVDATARPFLGKFEARFGRFRGADGRFQPIPSHLVPHHMVTVSSAKVNPAARLMIGYNTDPLTDRGFVSLDRTWTCELPVNQFVFPGRLRTSNDPLFDSWAHNESGVAIKEPGSRAVALMPDYRQSVPDCYFCITKLVAPARPGRGPQTVVMVWAVHGRGAAAVRQVLAAFPGPAACALIEKLSAYDEVKYGSWQVLVSARNFTKMGAEWQASRLEIHTLQTLEPIDA